MKCEGAETLLRAVLDNDEGVHGAVKRRQWLAGQNAAYLSELEDACYVLQMMCRQALNDQGGKVVLAS